MNFKRDDEKQLQTCSFDREYSDVHSVLMNHVCMWLACFAQVYMTDENLTQIFSSGNHMISLVQFGRERQTLKIFYIDYTWN